MKILQINCVYKKGSTGKIISDIHRCLQEEGHQSIVCYGRGPKVCEPNVYKFCPELLANIHTAVIRTGFVLNYGGNFLPTLKLKNIIRKEKPDVVHIHCANGSCVNIYSLFDFLAVNKYKTLITHHAGFYYTGSCEHAYGCKQFMDDGGCQKCLRSFHTTRSKTWDNSHRAWKKMYNAINKFEYSNLLFTAVSPWLKERSLLSPIVKNYRCEVVMNGVNTSVFNYKVEDNIIKKKLACDNKKIVLFVTAHFNPSEKNDNKGGWYLIELAKQMTDVIFVVVAFNILATSQLPDNVVIWGASKNQFELASLYRSANLSIILSRRETFSMVTAESLCCGTPVVGFKAGGPESIAFHSFSSFVEYGNIDALQQSIYQLLNLEIDKKYIANLSVERFAREVMTNNYIKEYLNLLDF
ncbi:MAG: glycosyltransferase [Paludibacteraceae bacterium]|nr:glycosyltransferase [Paludibacteraceae bacterium]